MRVHSHVGSEQKLLMMVCFISVGYIMLIRVDDVPFLGCSMIDLAQGRHQSSFRAFI
jgi:hypothetical protein